MPSSLKKPSFWARYTGAWYGVACLMGIILSIALARSGKKKASGAALDHPRRKKTPDK